MLTHMVHLIQLWGVGVAFLVGTRFEDVLIQLLGSASICEWAEGCQLCPYMYGQRVVSYVHM